ncbi:MAG: sialate O-acetylesterase [Lentisphaerota bacterium]
MIRKSILMGALLMAAGGLCADVKLPAIFNSDMVIQRETAAPVWGWADPEEKVTVSGSWGEKADTVAGKDGRWQVKLDTPKAGGPFVITVQGKNKIELNNVLSGDVWICSGQSNMQMPVTLWSRDASLYEKEVNNANYPEIRLFTVKPVPSQTPLKDTAGKWAPCSPATVGAFSAAGYYFGRKLYQELKIPVGLINTSWGGTCIEAWTPLDKQLADPVVKNMKTNYDKNAATYTPEGAKKKYDEEKAAWQKQVEEWKAAGSKGAQPREPRLAPHPQQHQNYPGNLYNGMIVPIVPFAAKGAIWYQGESNAGQAKNYRTQMERMITCWRDAWDQKDMPFYFVQLPNYLKAWTAPVEDGGWPVLREAFMKTAMEVPNTGMAITIDIGEENDIHPKNKQDVGDRLARVALYKTYGMKDTVWTGPIAKSCKFDDEKAIIQFENGGSPLAVKGEKLQGFALVNDEGMTVRADAKITGEDTVEVTAPEVKKAAMVYYAWANNPTGVNLINKAGLPASPFRFGAMPKANFMAKLLPAEAGDYKLVYSFDPTNSKLTDNSTKFVYDEDNSAKITGKFKKIAYFMALQSSDDKVSYAFVSLDPFTDDVRKIGVPVKSVGQSFQQLVTGMTVKSNVDGVKTGDYPEGGNIEFWDCNYGGNNSAKVPGASDSALDFGDQYDSSRSPGYGCMQIHNWKEKQSIICFNNFSGGRNADTGMGNWVGGKTLDWTFSGSAKNYARGEFKVLIQE